MESITQEIFEISKNIKSYNICTNIEIALNECKSYSYMITDNGKFKNFEIEVIDSIKDYVEYMQEIFDFEEIKHFIQTGFDGNTNLKIKVDSLNGGVKLFDYNIT